MELNLVCACGIELTADNVTPATAELLYRLFSEDHSHDEERAQVGVIQSYKIVSAGSGMDDSDEDEEDSEDVS